MNDVVRDLLTKAVQAQQAGDLAASAARGREVLDRDPANSQALHFLGRRRAREGDSRSPPR
jgi:hypothetical protein